MPQNGKELTEAYRTAVERILNGIAKSRPRAPDDLGAMVGIMLAAVAQELHKRNVALLRQETDSGRQSAEQKAGAALKSDRNAVYRGAYLELGSELKGAQKGAYKAVNAKLKDLAKSGQNTVTNAKREIMDMFRKEGVFKVTFSNGAQVDMQAYAAMVARTARTESQNDTYIGLAKQQGTNLVKCIGNSVTCAACAQYQNRVYCTDGRDKRFPSLYEGVNAPLRRGYKTIHPNCRCEFIPYFEDVQTPEQLERDMRQSNRPYRDDRTMRQKRYYQEWQEKNRQWRDEQNEYYAMKNTLGKDMPYTTLGGFKRAVRREDPPTDIKKFRYQNRDSAQYDRWKKILGEEKMPNTLDKFQDLKYNNLERFEELKTVKENAYLDMPFEDVKNKVGLLANDKARRWYNKNVHDIPNQIDTSKPLEQQARQACDLRNKYRTETRELMEDIVEQKHLDEDEPNATFEQLLKRKQEKYGLTGDDVYRSIIASASKTNTRVNKKFGLED